MQRTLKTTPLVTKVWPSDAGHVGVAVDDDVVTVPVEGDVVVDDAVETDVLELCEEEVDVLLDVPEELVAVEDAEEVLGSGTK